MIQITEKLWIKSDGHCYIIGKPRVRSVDGKERVEFRNPRYASTMAQAVKIAAEQTMRDEVESEAVTTLDAFAKRYAELTGDFFQRLEAIEH